MHKTINIIYYQDKQTVDDMSGLVVALLIPLSYSDNGPYSLLVRASYFISCSVYARSTSVIFIVCKWRWGCRYFLTSRVSMPCSEAIGLIIR